MKILAIFDNGGDTIDRYTVVTDIEDYKTNMFDMLGLSEGGTSVSQWATGHYDRNDDWHNRHLGKRVKFERLSEKTQKHIANRIFTEE